MTALGWYVTKHSVGLYSTTPPTTASSPSTRPTTQAAVDLLPGREPAGAVDGEVIVEATSVVFDRDGAPNLAILTALMPRR